MKKIGFGIAVLLFAVVLEVSWSGNFAYVTTGIGLIGLIFAFVGFISKENK